MVGSRLTNRPGPLCVPVWRSNPLRKVTAADQTGPHPAQAGARQGGLLASPARRSQAEAARAASPPYAARAVQPSTLPYAASTS